MEHIKFIKTVSKGSRFNQIYVPKEMNGKIEAGDLVEITLIKKESILVYSTNLKKLSDFKELLIKNILSFLKRYNNVEQLFIIGSFLTEKINYHDIDIAIITNKKIKKFDELIFNELTEQFNLKFHILTIEKERFEYLLKSCPLTQSMFSLFISDKKFMIKNERIIDKNHILFLLMMPEDLLTIKSSSRVFFDNIRRLITIELFLEDKELSIDKINNDIKNLLTKNISNGLLYKKLKNNEEIDDKTIEFLRSIIKNKLKNIKKLL